MNPEGRRICVKKVGVSCGDSPAAEASIKASLREISALSQLRHAENVILFRGVYLFEDNILIEMDLLDLTLDRLIDLADFEVPESVVVSLVSNIARGLETIHASGLIHRDVKPGNVLLGRDGSVKVCDFGLARNVKKATKFTDEVCTRWYKPIDLLFGNPVHTESIDIWGLGCVMAELLRLSALFPGYSDLHQLYLIQSGLGPVSESEWPEVVRFRDYGKVDFGPLQSVSGIEGLVRTASQEVKRAIGRCLVYNPAKRCTAREFLSFGCMRSSEISSKDQLATYIRDVMSNSSLSRTTSTTV
jgi:serine/threonine protein kinase